VTFYRRRLPHLYRADQPIFLTWRLYGSLPPNRCFPAAGVTSGKALAVLDCANVLDRYTLHAFVVMPHHIHMLVSPNIPLSQVTQTLKSLTAKRANQMLARTGNPFWQEESYDHLVRDSAEWERIKFYIEQNPVRAGLVKEASQYRWSSAGWATGRSPADQEVRPTL
jgi:putative DNA methylase